MRADEAGSAGYQHSVVGHRRQSRILPGPAALSGPSELKSRKLSSCKFEPTAAFGERRKPGFRRNPCVRQR